ncbi:MAG: outer membrane beta-barrel protein [Bacteroidales bacterium]|nr:outer membrane beta-barrel protein [Bacteroidales bacterium]
MKKNYLKTLLMVFVISLFTSSLFPQGVYVSVNAGYGINMSSHNLEYFGFYNYTSGNTSRTYEQVYVSLGKGLNFGGTFGLMFNKNLGAELGVSYLLGGKSIAKDEYVGGTTDYTISSKMLRLMPSIVIASGLEGINPYAKFGLIISSGSIIFDLEDKDSGDISIMKVKFDGGLALGLNAGIGVQFNMSDNISLFSEINMISLSYAPTKGEVIEATYNGTDMLPDMTTRQKEAEFVDSYTYNSSSPPPDSQPDQELKQKLPFGSFGVNFGLKIGF